MCDSVSNEYDYVEDQSALRIVYFETYFRNFDLAVTVMVTVTAEKVRRFKTSSKSQVTSESGSVILIRPLYPVPLPLPCL